MIHPQFWEALRDVAGMLRSFAYAGAMIAGAGQNYIKQLMKEAMAKVTGA